MSKITGYFAAEQYISSRFLLLVFGGVLVVIPAALAFGKGLISPRALGLVMMGVHRVRRDHNVRDLAARKGEVPSLVWQECRNYKRRNT